MPPLQALLALHGLWTLALLPVVVWAVRMWPPLLLRVVGYGATALGLTGLAILIGYELLTWYPFVTPEQQEYFPRRILYVLVTNTDLPVVQVFLAGIVLWFAAWRRWNCAVSRTDTENRPADETSAP
jgi:hypothetical protein